MFKKVTVVMLATNEKSNIYIKTLLNKLGWVTGKYPEDLEQFPNQSGTQNQHLYIVSDEPIKK